MRSPRFSPAVVDGLIALAQRFDPKIEAKCNRHYIGLMREGTVHNYAAFDPRKGPVVTCYLRLPESEIASLVEQGLDADYNANWRRPRLRLKGDDLVTHEVLLLDLLRRARGEEG